MSHKFVEKHIQTCIMYMLIVTDCSPKGCYNFPYIFLKIFIGDNNAVFWLKPLN